MWSERITRLIGPSFWTRRAVVLAGLLIAVLLLTWIEVDEFLTYRALKHYVTSIGGKVTVTSLYEGYSFEKQYGIYGPERDLSNEEQAKLHGFARHLNLWRIHKQPQVILSYQRSGKTTTVVLP